jgi:hypothetical protein
VKIGILGGTGDLGKGMALRWSRRHEVFIGSRNANRGREAAATYAEAAQRAYGDGAQAIRGEANEVVATAVDAVVLSLPAEESIDYVRRLTTRIGPKALIISPVVAMQKEHGVFVYRGTVDGVRSLAEVFADDLAPRPVVAAFHTVPAAKLANPAMNVEADVLMAGDDAGALEIVAGLVREIPHLRPLHAGPLRVARLIEPLTPLLLNVGLRNRLREPSLRIV